MPRLPEAHLDVRQRQLMALTLLWTSLCRTLPAGDEAYEVREAAAAVFLYKVSHQQHEEDAHPSANDEQIVRRLAVICLIRLKRLQEADHRQPYASPHPMSMASTTTAAATRWPRSACSTILPITPKDRKVECSTQTRVGGFAKVERTEAC